MNCNDETRLLVHAYLDGELDATRSVEIERHLDTCPACTGTREDVLSLRSALRSGNVYEVAPERVRRQVRRSLRAESGPRVPWFTALREHWIGFGSVGAAVAAALAVLVVTRPFAMSNQMADEVVSSHVRSLMAQHLTDVASSDQHTVKPWFIGKLDFSPRVVDLADRGFPLVGGRLDYVGGRPAAALVYNYRKHVINLFIQPATGGPVGTTVAESKSRNGYSLAHWANNGMEYWAITDAEHTALDAFVRLLQEKR